MTKYLINRILRGICSIVIVVGIVMVMVYSALDRNLIFAADSMYSHVKSNAKEVYMMQQWERYGYVDYVPYADYMRELVRDEEITQEQYNAALSFEVTPDFLLTADIPGVPGNLRKFIPPGGLQAETSADIMNPS